MSIDDILKKKFKDDLVTETLKSKKYKRIYFGNAKNVDIKLCEKMYIDYNLPIYKIAMLYGLSDTTIRKLMDNAKIKNKGHYVGKNSNNNYFGNIDTADKAYYLGLIVADGCIINLSTATKTKLRLSVELTLEDSYILEKMNEYGNFNSKISICHKGDIKPRARLMVASSKLCNDLKKLGVVERKSKYGTIMPNLHESLIPHFIRGYFDGDGIAFSAGYVGFCGCERLLTSIKDYLVKHGMSDQRVYYNKQNNIYYIQWSSLKDRRKFVQIIYKDKKDLFLKRKYEKIIKKLP